MKVVWRVLEVRLDGGVNADEVRSMNDQFTLSESEFESEEAAVVALNDMTKEWSCHVVHFEVRKFFKVGV